MESCFVNESLKKINTKNIFDLNSLESIKLNERMEDLNESKKLKEQNSNKNKNEKIENKTFIKSRKNNDEKIELNAHESIKSNEVIVKMKKSLEKSKENSDKCLDLKKAVKSRYILKKIFSFLGEKKKIYIAKYNIFINMY